MKRLDNYVNMLKGGKINAEDAKIGAIIKISDGGPYEYKITGINGNTYTLFNNKANTQLNVESDTLLKSYELVTAAPSESNAVAVASGAPPAPPAPPAATQGAPRAASGAASGAPAATQGATQGPAAAAAAAAARALAEGEAEAEAARKAREDAARVVAAEAAEAAAAVAAVAAARKEREEAAAARAVAAAAAAAARAASGAASGASGAPPAPPASSKDEIIQKIQGYINEITRFNSEANVLYEKGYEIFQEISRISNTNSEYILQDWKAYIKASLVSLEESVPLMQEVHRMNQRYSTMIIEGSATNIKDMSLDKLITLEKSAETDKNKVKELKATVEKIVNAAEGTLEPIRNMAAEVAVRAAAAARAGAASGAASGAAGAPPKTPTPPPTPGASRSTTIPEILDGNRGQNNKLYHVLANELSDKEFGRQISPYKIDIVVNSSALVKKINNNGRMGIIVFLSDKYPEQLFMWIKSSTFEGDDATKSSENKHSLYYRNLNETISMEIERNKGLDKINPIDIFNHGLERRAKKDELGYNKTSTASTGASTGASTSTPPGSFEPTIFTTLNGIPKSNRYIYSLRKIESLNGRLVTDKIFNLIGILDLELISNDDTVQEYYDSGPAEPTYFKVTVYKTINGKDVFVKSGPAYPQDTVKKILDAFKVSGNICIVSSGKQFVKSLNGKDLYTTLGMLHLKYESVELYVL